MKNQQQQGVLKQNRKHSATHGIPQLHDPRIMVSQRSLRGTYGERSCEDSEKLLLMEANDNHEEEWQPKLAGPWANLQSGPPSKARPVHASLEGHAFY